MALNKCISYLNYSIAIIKEYANINIKFPTYYNNYDYCY